MNTTSSITPDWKWGTAEGSREFDRLNDRMLTFLEKIQWLEEAEDLSLAFQASREQAKANKESISHPLNSDH